MSDGLSINVGETWGVVLTRRVGRHRIRRAHGPRDEDMSKMHPTLATPSMLNRHQQAACRQRKGGPEIGTENRPRICPAERFHRQNPKPQP